MDFIYDIIINLLSDGISFLLGVLSIFLFPFLKKTYNVCLFEQANKNILYKKDLLLL